MLPPVESQQADIGFLLHEEGIVGAGWRGHEERPRAKRFVRERPARFLRERFAGIRAFPLLYEDIAQATLHLLGAGRGGQIGYSRHRCARNETHRHRRYRDHPAQMRDFLTINAHGIAWRKLQTPGVLRPGSAPVSTTIVAACPGHSTADSVSTSRNVDFRGFPKILGMIVSSNPDCNRYSEKTQFAAKAAHLQSNAYETPDVKRTDSSAGRCIGMAVESLRS